MWSWFLARLKGIFNLFASIIIFVVLLMVVSTVVGIFTQPKLPGELVLTMDLRNGLPDKKAPNPFADGRSVGSVIDAVTALAKAESDDRVKGAFMRIGGGVSSSEASELRAAIKAFRAKGKFVVAHAQAFYSTGMGDYFLASSADEIWLQPVSEMNTAGVTSTGIFLRNLLDKIEAKPEFTQRYEYKNAANMFMEKDFTVAHREANLRLIESVFESATAGIAADRKMTREQIVALIDSAPHLTQEAIDKKLIDKQGYDDEAEDAALARAGGKAELMTLSKYYAQAGSPWEGMGRPTIAFIHGDGQINDGESEGGGPFGGESSMGGDTIAKAIRDATEDDDVKAILFRVNSPGGSALASDQILDAVKKAQKAGKKVVVSMADVAASGGYYVSLSADKIFAHETTITGSIGVLSGKIVTAGSWALLGIDMKALGVGKNALFDSAVQSFTPEQWAAFNKGVDQIYEDFTAKVAKGRKLPIEKVREIAKGRVWTGADAKARGLVDEFGGFRAALESTKALAGLPADAEINLKTFPAAKNPFEEIAEMFGTTAEVVRTVSLMGKIMETEPVADAMKMMVDQSKQSRAPQMRMEPQKTN
jgi:protease-4